MFRFMHEFFNDLPPFGILAPDLLVCFTYLMFSYDIYCNSNDLPYLDMDIEVLVSFL